MQTIDSKAHDLFLLLLNLSQFSNRERTLELFIDAIKRIWPNLGIFFSRTGMKEGVCFEIASKGKLYGCIYIDAEGESDQEDLDLLQNAAAMLALVLRKQEQEQLLNTETNSLKKRVRESSVEMERLSKRYELARQSGGIAVWERDTKSDRMEYSPEFEKILGISPDELEESYDSYLSMIHPDDYSDVLQNMKVALENRQGYSREYRLIIPGGASRWVLEAAEFFPDDRGDLTRLVGTVQDITERKRAEERLRESEEMHRLLFENAGVGIAYYDSDGVLMSFNSRAAFYMGGTQEEFVGKSFIELYGKEDGAAYKKRLEAAAESESPLEFEDYVELPGGGRWFQSVYNSLKRANGSVLCVQVISSDITRIKELEISLKDSIRRTEEAVRAGNIALWEWDLESDTITFAFEWQNNFGYSKNELGPGFSDFAEHIHPDDRQRIIGEVNDFIAGKKSEHKVAYRMRHKDGSYKWLMTQASILNNEEGNPRRMLGTHIDITEQKQKEEMIRAALSENRVLLKELHHRTKNNLQLVTSMLRLKAHTVTSDSANEVLDEIEQKIHSIALVHEKLYQSDNFALIDLKEYIGDVMNLFSMSFKDSGKLITLTYECGEISVSVDIAIPLGLVLNEIITNAVKYAFPGREKGSMQFVFSLDKDYGIRIVCRDDGVGIQDIGNVRRNAGIGFETIFGLIENQLEGSVKLKNTPGLEYDIRIPFENEY